jgi:hypothetical protein
MMATAERIRPRRDGGHLFEQYYLFWTAFNHIYTTIAQQKGCRHRIKKNDDGSVATVANGNVNIPEVIVVSERDQIDLAFQEFDADLKHKLVLHEGTGYFAHRIPHWQGIPIEYDAFGQRVNGVIDVGVTGDSQYPVWSPIDIQYYEGCLENPSNAQLRDFLARQIVDLLHMISTNLMVGSSRKLDDGNDMTVVDNALPMLKLIVASFTQ